MKIDASVLQLISLLVSLISPALLLWVKSRIESKQLETDAKVSVIDTKVDAYHKDVDGMKTELVEAVKGRGEAEGNIQGRIEKMQELKNSEQKNISVESVNVTAEKATVISPNPLDTK